MYPAGKDVAAKPKIVRVAVYADRAMDGDTLAVHDGKGDQFKVRLEAAMVRRVHRRLGWTPRTFSARSPSARRCNSL
jgi:hypothetical protein